MRRPKEWTRYSKEFRSRHPRCEVCGKTLNIDVHHILPWQHYRDLRYDDDNCISLCKRHHAFGKESAHHNPLWFIDWLKGHLPDKFEKIVKKMKKS